MTGLQRGLALALAHVVLASGVAAKYLIDRERLPRVWVETRGYDPNAPIRGRYVLLSLLPVSDALPPEGASVVLEARDGKLVARAATPSERSELYVWNDGRGGLSLEPPVPFFLPEHADDPTLRREPLWMEVTVPPRGAPRPLRLGVKRGDEIVPVAAEP